MAGTDDIVLRLSGTSDDLQKAVTAARSSVKGLGVEVDTLNKKQPASGLGKSLDEATAKAKQASAEAKKLQATFAQAIGGGALEQRAKATAAAIGQIGGATKLTDAEVKKHLNTLNQWTEKAGKIGKTVSPQILSTRDALQQANAQATKTPSLFNSISKTSLAMGAALTGAIGGLAWKAVNKLTSEIGAFVAQGSKLPALQSSFTRLSAGMKQDGDAMLANMTKSTRGLVSNYDLMQTANKAMLLGLPVTAKSMGELSDAAVKLGKAMGKDATSSLDDLITALGRSSPMILDNLGLTVKVGEANEAYAAKLGKTSAQLTDAEKKMAFYEAAMEAARKKTDELGDQTMTLGEIASSTWTKFGNVVSDASGIVNNQVGKILTSKDSLIEFLKLMAAAGSPGAALAAMQNRERALAAAGEQATGAMRKRAGKAGSEDFQFEELQREAKALAEQALAPLTKAQRDLALEFDRGGLSAEKIVEKLNSVKRTAGVSEAQIAKLLETQTKATKSSDGYAQSLKTIREAEIPLSATQERRATSLLALGHSHETVAKSMKVSVVAVKEFDEAQKRAIKSTEAWAKLEKDIREKAAKEARKNTDLFLKDQQKQADAVVELQGRQLAALVEFGEKNRQLAMSGTELRLRQIDIEHKARVDGLKALHGEESALFRIAKKEVDDFYNHQRDVAEGTYETIVERMRAAGVKTRDDLKKTAMDAVRDYAQMKASAKFNAAETKAHWERALAALKVVGLDMKNDAVRNFIAIATSGTATAEEIQAAFERMHAEIAAAAEDTSIAWGNALLKTAGALDRIGRHFDGTFGEILQGASDVAQGIANIALATDPLSKTLAAIDLAITVAKKAINLFRDEQHEAVNDLRDDFFQAFGPSGTGAGSAFRNLADQLHQIAGPAGDALFHRLMNAKKVDEFNAAMKAVNETLRNVPATMADQASAAGFQTQAQLKAIANDAVALWKYMRDSGLYSAEAVEAAWERANAALAKSGDESVIAANKAREALKGLQTELDGLYASIADEMPEEITEDNPHGMGAVEYATRQRIAQVEAEIEAKKKLIEEETAARQEAADAADKAVDESVSHVGQSIAGLEGALQGQHKVWDDWADHAIQRAREVERGVNAISFGRSPGGLKEIPIQLAIATKAAKDFEQETSKRFASLVNQVSADISPTITPKVHIPDIPLPMIPSAGPKGATAHTAGAEELAALIAVDAVNRSHATTANASESPEMIRALEIQAEATRQEMERIVAEVQKIAEMPTMVIEEGAFRPELKALAIDDADAMSRELTKVMLKTIAGNRDDTLRDLEVIVRRISPRGSGE